MEQTVDLLSIIDAVLPSAQPEMTLCRESELRALDAVITTTFKGHAPGQAAN